MGQGNLVQGKIGQKKRAKVSLVKEKWAMMIFTKEKLAEEKGKLAKKNWVMIILAKVILD